MDLKLVVPSREVDFSPVGTTRFLTNFSPRLADARKRINAFEDDPRSIIEHAFELTTIQRALLADTTDDELKTSLQPVFEALRAGGTLAVANIEMSARGALVPQQPEVLDQQQAPRQIVITIGRGRCKITITIDL